MDTQLFMECEEEELEPWQQVDDTVEEDDDFMDYTRPVEDSPDSSPPHESPPPAPPPAPAPKAPVLVQTQTRSLPVSMPTAPVTMATLNINKPTPTILKTTPTTKAPPIVQQATPLILSQLPQGTFLVPSTRPQQLLITTQGFPMVNSGTPLVLNLPPGSTVLQPGQTLVKPGEVLKPAQTLFKPGQPLTLIQSPSVGQIVRPVTPVRGPAPSAAPGLMHLTIHTSTPERVAPVGSVSSVSSPALPAGSTNGVPRSITILSPPKAAPTRPSPPTPPQPPLPPSISILKSGPAHVSSSPAKVTPSPAHVTIAPNRTVVTFSQPRLVTMPPSSPSLSSGPSLSSDPTLPSDLSDPSRVIMSVEEFYYGSHDGDERLRDSHKYTAMLVQFPCTVCPHQANNNLRLMQHMLTHWKPANRGEDKKSCKFCYRHFSSAPELQTHLDKVHGPNPSNSLCRICEWAFDNEPVFLNHMKTNHKPGEMPYICQVCCYRSSFYSDVIQHFATFHRETRFLLCVFCLKVLKNSENYQQHLLRHQHEAFHCNRCRLQFIYLKEKVHHKTEHHRSYRRPARLEGLPPGSKVTIRTFGRRRPALPSEMPHPSQPSPAPSNMIQPISIKTEPQPLLLQKARTAHKKLEHSTALVGLWRCVECGDQATALSAHYPTHVRCLLCSYGTCCSKAYASHMVHSHHFPRSKEPTPRLKREPPPSRFSVICADCRFRAPSGDEMAVHLALNPTHSFATCTPRILTDLDVDFSLLAPQRSDWPTASLPGVIPRPLACDWSTPDCSVAGAPPFTHWSGPSHNVPRSGDAIDFFELLFPAELVDLITAETNSHVKTLRFLFHDPLLSDWTTLTSSELKAFLGLVVLMGLQTLPDPAHYWSYSHYDQSYMFNQVMSHRRFTQILRSLRPGSTDPTPVHRSPAPLSRSPAHHRDPLQMFRRMLQIQGKAMWDTYRPRCCLSLDRALLPGTPSQDPNQGLNQDQGPYQDCPRPGPALPQVWLLCDSKSGYCHRLHIQTSPGPAHGPDMSLVLDLLSGLEHRPHQLFLSNALCTEDLLHLLHHRGLYGSASFPRNHPHFPSELWDDRPLEHPGDFVQKQRGVVLATRWKDVKEMGCLSTNAAPGHTDAVWRRSQTRVGTLDRLDRPEAFRLLQENMRGADICKQLLACNALGGVASERRWRNLFWFLVNISVVNAFIVLRETRRDCPPSWVQKGLFTQARFRKRLGTQLAKCFRCSNPADPPPLNLPPIAPAIAPVLAPVLAPELAPALTPAPPGQEAQRHRIGKISRICKRCKNCHSKNLRHESVHGCVVCSVNLCQTGTCFWEFHGLSADTPVSPRLGFVMKTGQISFVEPKKEGGFSAPIEESDEEYEEFKPEKVESPESMDQSFPSILQQLFSERQLQVALCALCEGVSKATRVYATEPRLIHRWLREANANVHPDPESEGVESEVVERLVKFVLSMREQEGALTYTGLSKKVSSLRQKGLHSLRFSYDWAVSFMLRAKLQFQGVGTRVSQELPLQLGQRVAAFQTFTQKVIQGHALASSAVASMDELHLFADLSRASDVLQMTGTSPLVTVYLTALSDGTLMPALALTASPLDEGTLPEFVLTDIAPQSTDEALELWRTRVWTEHVRDLQLQKCVLIVDAHGEHTTDAFLAALSESGTLPAVIPKGLGFRLHPLEICVKPLLQRYLLRRWRALPPGHTQALHEDALASMWVKWTVEALSHISSLPEVIQRSFRVAGVLEEKEEEEELQQVQDELMKTLSLKLADVEMSWEQEQDFWNMEPSEEDKMEEQKEREKQSRKEESETDTEDETGQNKEEERRGGEREQEEEERKEERENIKTQEREKGEEERKEGNERLKERKTEEREEGGEEETEEIKEEEIEERSEGIREEGKEERDDMDAKKAETRMIEDREEEGEREAEQGAQKAEGITEEKGEEGRERERWEERKEEEEKTKEPEKEEREVESVRAAGEEEEETKEEPEKEEREVEREKAAGEEEKAQPRHETRILMGEDLGDEWQVKVQSSEEDDKMDES